MHMLIRVYIISNYPIILLMVQKSCDHHLGCIKKPGNGIFTTYRYRSTGDFTPVSPDGSGPHNWLSGFLSDGPTPKKLDRIPKRRIGDIEFSGEFWRLLFRKIPRKGGGFFRDQMLNQNWKRKRNFETK